MNFQVELHNFCNFTCGYCPNRDMARRREFMSNDVWDAILYLYIVPYRRANIAGTLCPPTFIGHKDDEPLIDRKFPARLRDISNYTPDMKIDIYSNGVLLPAWAERGQDFIQFLSTLSSRVRFMMSYHPRNHDGSANDYGPVVKYLSEVLLDPPPNVEFITVSHKSRWVSPEMQEGWRRTWAGLPITVHSNCSINPWTGLMEDQATCHYDGCPYADFGHWFFGATGNIIACCLDLEEEIVLGNVLRDDPVEMFANTEAFYAEQRRIREVREQHPLGVCRNCFGQHRNDALVELVPLGMKP
jgi:sulfatase maturation enzyme AslB (radical SAM superfamily)